MNLGLLSPLLGRRRLVKVGGANPKIGGGGQGRNKIRYRYEVKFRLGGGQGRSFPLSGDAPTRNLKGPPLC